MYQKNLDALKEEVNQEAVISGPLSIFRGPAYLKEMDGVDIKPGSRESVQRETCFMIPGNDAETLENHSKRPEVKEALANGTGEDVRVSGTVGKEMYYYATLLQDGTVLRVSKDDGQPWELTARDTLPVMGVLAAVMMIFAWHSRALADRTADPTDQ